jgi:site-specific DNA recombinase
MTSAAPTTLRCAVYTRKSHEEGLDQDFNSLDAQSESCRAYILSQAGLGWQLRDRSYDDGGISGGHMDRPGLQALISDIEAGLIDVVVVYKVDRLTRSLSDFSRLVEAFDKHGVSFVSVTQAFNTTTSMGRLTLNVLLSFAQFEREVTAERIRDKIAASKAKGMWMGGFVPLGYRSEGRKLVIEEGGRRQDEGLGEAETVRMIFRLYAEHQNVRLVKLALDEMGVLSKVRTTKTGKTTGGKPFSRGHLHRILTNPVYIGKIVHKGTVHDGLHGSIIRQEVWKETQALLENNTGKRTKKTNANSSLILAGLLEDADGHPLVPHYTKAHGKRYRYYVSRDLKTGDQDSGWRIPAKTIEPIALSIIREHLTDDCKLIQLLHLEEADVTSLQAMLTSAKELADQITLKDRTILQSVVPKLIDRIVLEQGQIRIYLSAIGLVEYLPAIPTSLHEGIRDFSIAASINIRRRGQEMKMVLGAKELPASNIDDALVLLVARAVLLHHQLETNEITSIGEFAEAQGIHHSDAKKLVPLGYLAPSIIEDIIKGHQPVELTARELHRMTDLPLCWAEQRQRLAFH